MCSTRTSTMLWFQHTEEVWAAYHADTTLSNEACMNNLLVSECRQRAVRLLYAEISEENPEI